MGIIYQSDRLKLGTWWLRITANTLIFASIDQSLERTVATGVWEGVAPERFGSGGW
ncbi:MAG: hypothetical protein WAL47_12895 [Pyrinomonadaceae bacterium]